MNEEKEQWEKVLLRIIAIVKYLVKNNLTVQETNGNLYKKNNVKFFNPNENVSRICPVMEEHVRRIQQGELQNNFFSHKI